MHPLSQEPSLTVPVAPDPGCEERLHDSAGNECGVCVVSSWGPKTMQLGKTCLCAPALVAAVWTFFIEDTT